MEENRQAPTNKTCPLCEQLVPRDVEQYPHKISGEERTVHKSCVMKLVELYLNDMYKETKRIRKRRKRRKKKEESGEQL